MPLTSNIKPDPSGISVAWFALSILLSLVVLLLAQVFGEPYFPLILIAGIVGTAFVVLIFLRPAWGMYFLVLSFFSLHWLTDSLQILPKPFNFIPDVLIITVFLSGVFRQLRRGGALPRTPIDGLVLTFIGIAVLSHLLNHADSRLVLLNGLFRQNLKFILLFYAIVYLSFAEPIQRRIILLFIGLGLLQVPVAMAQFFTYRSRQFVVGPNEFAWDFAGGTLGVSATGVLALLSLMVMSLLFGLAQTTRQVRYVILGLSFFIPAVVGEGKIVFVLAPLMVIFLLTYRWAILKVRTVFLFSAFAAAFILAFVALRLVLPEARSLDVLSSLSYTTQNYERSLAATGGFPRSRIGDIQFTMQLLSVDSVRTLFGYGPGSSSHAFVEAADGSLHRQFEEFEGPFFYFSFIQLSTTMLEYGVLGLSVYALMLWQVYRRNNRFIARTRDMFWRGVGWGLRGVVFVYVVGIIYWRIWSTEVLASMFWMLAGIILVQSRRLHDVRLTPGHSKTAYTFMRGSG